MTHAAHRPGSVATPDCGGDPRTDTHAVAAHIVGVPWPAATQGVTVNELRGAVGPSKARLETACEHCSSTRPSDWQFSVGATSLSGECSRRQPLRRVAFLVTHGQCRSRALRLWCWPSSPTSSQCARRHRAYPQLRRRQRVGHLAPFDGALGAGNPADGCRAGEPIPSPSRSGRFERGPTVRDHAGFLYYGLRNLVDLPQLEEVDREKGGLSDGR